MNSLKVLSTPEQVPTPKKTSKKKVSKKTKPKAKAKTQLKPKRNWSKIVALIGVGFTMTLSSILNAYANSQHATNQFFGILLGASIPMITLILGTVASMMYTKKIWSAAYACAGSGIGLLFFSIYDCGSAISSLTGNQIWWCLPMAVAIDAGMISLKWAATKAKA